MAKEKSAKHSVHQHQEAKSNMGKDERDKFQAEIQFTNFIVVRLRAAAAGFLK